jgi:beta-galactosidase
VHRLDPTRPVTAAIHGTLGPTLIPAPQSVRPDRVGKVDNASVVYLDVPGYNYRLDEIAFEHPRHPERVVYASETFTRDALAYRRLMDTAPYFVGEFLWTGMDYIGEAAIGRSTPIAPGTLPYGLPVWPYTNANCGDLDLTGAQKPPSLARDVIWGLSPVEVLVHRPIPEGKSEYVSNWGWPDEEPRWTWPGEEGKPLAVRVFTAGDRVDLFLNGRKLASRSIAAADDMRAPFEVPYAPGVLQAVAYRDGRAIGSRRLRTVGPAAQLRVAPENARLTADRQGLAYLRLSVVDREGQVLPDDARDIRIAVSGPAELVAFGSGNPQWTGSLQRPATRTFRGEALAVLRSTGKPGPVRVTADAEGLASASAALRAG